ncbi:MAG: hypothetical protein WD423_10345 [Rhodothermales bacterium]
MLLASVLAGTPPSYAQDVESPLAYVAGDDGARRDDDSEEPAQEIILSFRYGDLVTADVSARFLGSDVYVPVGGLFSLLGVAWQLDRDAPAISGFYLDETRSYRLDFGSGTAHIGSSTVPMLSDDYIEREHDVFVKPYLLDDVFGLRVEFDLAALSIHVRSDEPLPVEMNRRRARQRPAEIDPFAAFRHAPLAFQRTRKSIGGGVADYNVSINKTHDRTRVNLQTALGAEVLGGDLAWQGRAGVGSTAFVAHDYVRWRYVMDDTPLLRQVRLGTLHATGLRPDAYRGIHLTNQPARPERLFGEYTISGQAEPDWELELYMDDRLIDVTRAPASGVYRFQVPVTYGSSQFHVQAYGPAGEVRHLRRRIQVPFSMVSPGDLRYNVHVGERRERSGFLGQADVGYGVSKHLTTRLGFDYADGAPGRRPTVYGSVTSRLLHHYLATMDVSDRGLQRFSIHAFYPSQSSLEVQYIRSDPSTRHRLSGRRSHTSASGFLPFHVGRFPMSVRLSASRSQYGGDQQYRFRSHLQAAFNSLQLYVTAETDVTESYRSSTIRPAMSFVLSRPPPSMAYFRGLLLSARARYNASDHRLDGIELNAAHSVTPDTRVQLFTHLGMSGRASSVGIRLSTALPFARSVTDTRVTSSSTNVVQSVRGSLIFDKRSGRILAGDRPAVGRAAAALRLFVDRNANGTLDADEHVLEHNAVHLDRGSALSSGHQDGVTHVGDLLPYERYTARIEEGAIANPLWVPDRSSFSFIADPNGVKQIDVPLFAAGVVEGTVVDARTGEPLAVSGLLVRIVDVDEGSERVLQTFSDGSFYEMGFRPGTYEVQLDADQLHARDLSAAAASERFVVRATENGDFVDDLRLAVVERPAAPERLLAGESDASDSSDTSDAPEKDGPEKLAPSTATPLAETTSVQPPRPAIPIPTDRPLPEHGAIAWPTPFAIEAVHADDSVAARNSARPPRPPLSLPDVSRLPTAVFAPGPALALEASPTELARTPALALEPPAAELGRTPPMEPLLRIGTEASAPSPRLPAMILWICTAMLLSLGLHVTRRRRMVV